MNKAIGPSIVLKHLVFQGEREAELVGVLVETGSIDGSTKVDLDTRTEGLGVTKARSYNAEII